MEYLLGLDDPRCRDIAEAGTKGAVLATLRSRGFSVPPGAVVTTRLFREAAWVTAGGRMPLIDAGEQLARTSSSDAAEFADRLGPVALPESFAAELREFLAAYPPDKKFAVRSSSPFEDSGVAAYAGQFNTYLDRVGFEQILDAVVGCLLSYWNNRAVAYRRFHHVGGSPSMAVVLQEMVACDLAGVAFSINPVSGNLNEVLINAGTGTGQTVVDGAIGVAHFVLSKSEHALVASDDAPISGASVETDAGRREALIEVSKLTVALERTAGFPQDVEWGIEGGKLFLLQTRPVTTIPAKWTRDEAAERFPRPVTPLSWDIVEDGFHHSLAHSFALMAFPPFRGKWFSIHDHYVYGNANAMEIYLRRLGMSLQPLGRGLQGLPQVLHELRWVYEALDHWHRHLDAYLTMIGNSNATPLSNLAPAELWRFVLTVRSSGYDYFRPNIANAMGHRVLHAGLRAVLKHLLGETDADSALHRLTLGCGTKTDLVNQELHELARRARMLPALEAIIRGRSSKEALAALSDFPAFSEPFDRFVHTHFHREVDHFLDAFYPTLGEEPWRVLDSIKVMLDSDRDVPQENKSVRSRKYYESLADAVGKCPESYRAAFVELVELTRALMAIDDIEHYETARLQVLFRRAFGHLGKYLQRNGYAEEELDIFFARYGSIEAALSDGSWRAVADEIRSAKASFAKALVSTPAWIAGETAAVTSAAFTLTGLACSAGSAEGDVRIVRTAEDFKTFPKGAVLVANATPPAWTPLFYGAAAVVTDGGGPLSHGAIVAREIGIPAVMGVKGASSILRDGERIRVNGTSGTVVRLQN